LYLPDLPTLKNHTATFVGASFTAGLTMLSSFTPAAQATTLTYSGTTTATPSQAWNRPNIANAGTLSVPNTTTPAYYSAFEFRVSQSGSYILDSNSNTNRFNNFTYLYAGAFNASNPFANFVVGNDDNQNNQTSSGFTRNLVADTNYFFVTTGLNNGDVGRFTNTISDNFRGNPSISQVVPEPATIIGSLLAFGYGAYSRRKMKLAQSIAQSQEDN
jgi:hypothetical protein